MIASASAEDMQKVRTSQKGTLNNLGDYKGNIM
jgi:hypothetical protein